MRGGHQDREGDAAHDFWGSGQRPEDGTAADRATTRSSSRDHDADFTLLRRKIELYGPPAALESIHTFVTFYFT